jgi:hypothetical protein
VVEDLVNDGAGVLYIVGPVGWSCLVLRLHKRVTIVLLVVVCDLSGTSSGEADLDLRWRQAAFCNEHLALTFLLAGDISASTDVRIRLRVRVGRPIDWCSLLRGYKGGLE